jgi:hypothetical protein
LLTGRSRLRLDHCAWEVSKVRTDTGPGFPHFADQALFFGVGGVVEVLAFVLDRHDPAVGELADEIGVEPILGGLQAKRGAFAGEIADPELQARGWDARGLACQGREVVGGHWIVVRPVATQFEEQALFGGGRHRVELDDTGLVKAWGTGNSADQVGDEVAG